MFTCELLGVSKNKLGKIFFVKEITMYQELFKRIVEASQTESLVFL